MGGEKRTLLVRTSKMLHFLITIALFAYFWERFLQEYHINIAARYHVLVCIGYAFLMYFFCRTYDAYLIEYSRIVDIAFSLNLSSAIAVILTYAAIMVGWEKYYSPRYFIILLVVQIIFNALWTMAAIKVYYAYNKPAKTLLVYRNKTDLMRLNEVDRFGKKYKVERRLENPQSYEEVVQAIGDCETIFLAGVNADIRNGVAKYCMETGVRGFFLPHVGDIILMGGSHVRAFSVPIIGLQNTGGHPEYLLLKRAVDILLSLLAIIILSPLMLITAVAIKLYDGGPVLYKQVRLTKGGREFKIYKFRSMRPDAEKDGVARLSSGKDDERITPVGKVLRACRLDELPQLFNIFKGDMTIVGPRPERPEIAKDYAEAMPAFNLRLKVKAGLTGYAQVYGKYNTDPYDKLEMDLIYINKMSLLMDLQLMFATVRILFKKDSTEGISKDETTAMK